MSAIKKLLECKNPTRNLTKNGKYTGSPVRLVEGSRESVWTSCSLAQSTAFAMEDNYGVARVYARARFRVTK
jgi:hypothetical protein